MRGKRAVGVALVDPEVGMDGWLVWLIVTVVLGVIELVTLTAALGVVAGAALVTAVFTAIGLPLPFQIAVFTAASATGVILIRPAVHRFMHQPPLVRFGVDALIGKSAYVLKEVTGMDGRVRIGGEEWSARACDDTMVIPEGKIVDVMQIEGSTAIVYPREDTWRSL